MIICITGLAGSGKTSVANYIVNRLKNLNYPVLHYTSDMIGDSIFFDKYHIRTDNNADYTSDELSSIYNGLFLLFEKIFEANPGAIIVTDGAYRKSSQRLRLKLIAKQLGVKFLLIKANTKIDTAKERLLDRNSKINQSGWLDPKEYEEPIGEDAVVIDNNSTISNLEKQVEKMLQEKELVEYYIAG